MDQDKLCQAGSNVTHPSYLKNFTISFQSILVNLKFPWFCLPIQLATIHLLSL